MIRPIAIHLPQFHQIPENDEWWGKGFTEWTNVTKAKPLFSGHYQPHLPTDLGFYDMRLHETRQAQADLAKAHGIFGFCYYHYWFNGRLLLETPLHQMLELGKPDMPFMLCWANENWTRRWDGMETDVLMEQKYNSNDDVEHIKYLMRFLKDPRYIRVDGKPVVVIYKTFFLPDPQKTAEIWRTIAKENGMELYLCHMVFYKDVTKLEKGFDAAIDFEPFGMRRANESPQIKKSAKFAVDIFKRALKKMEILLKISEPLYKYNVRDYEDFFKNLSPLKKINFKIFPSLVPGWDNSARRNNPSLILNKSTPQKFGKWLKNILSEFTPYSEQENFIFINAWNEWAEGNHLEPCRKWGKAYLETLKEEIDNFDNNIL